MLPSKLSRFERSPSVEAGSKVKRWIKPKHRDFVRGHACSACGSTISIEVAHIRIGTDGGTGLRPSDYYTVSLCKLCHAEQHTIGERTFWENAGIDPHAMAEAFAKASPCAREIAEHKRSRADAEG